MGLVGESMSAIRLMGEPRAVFLLDGAPRCVTGLVGESASIHTSRGRISRALPIGTGQRGENTGLPFCG